MRVSRFNGCVHVNEPGCAVKMAVDEGILSKDRYQSYVTLYEELKIKRNILISFEEQEKIMNILSAVYSSAVLQAGRRD